MSAAPSFSAGDPMKVLLVHNHYQQPGGEDAVFAAEGALLEAYGHQVVRHVVHNDEVDGINRVRLAGMTIWNTHSYDRVRAIVAAERPEVVHFHNTLPLISPAGFYAARTAGAAVVLTLHNYRLLCPSAIFLRDEQVCEECLGKLFAWPSVRHGCYRGSRAASAAVSVMLAGHALAGTWTRQIDAYIALTDFARDKYVQGGLPAAKMHVKPNFLADDPGPGEGEGDYALFIGRLAPEKGLRTLLAAWALMDSPPPLKIVGDGPLAAEVRDAIAGGLGAGGVEWLGQQGRSEVLALARGARLLIFPSIWYEGFPMAIVEAFAAGLPVVGSGLGSMASIIQDGGTGLLVRPGDAAHLAARVQEVLACPDALVRMRRAARAAFETHYTAPVNHRLLLDIYTAALAERTHSSNVPELFSPSSPRGRA